MNPRFNDGYERRPTVGEARRYFVDFMRYIYRFITDYLRRTVPRWATRKVEYLFSVPTDWLDPALCADFELMVKRVGFGRNASKERVRIAMTEAEAAAVCAARHHYAVHPIKPHSLTS